VKELSPMNFKTVTVDVREDIRDGREPFSRIMKAAAALHPDEQLLLVAPFEPVPLFRVMEKQGFAFRAQALSSGDWEVLFTRRGDSAPMTAASAAVVSDSRKLCEVVDIDVRGLEPPQPMVKILETLATLPVGAELRAHTDRRPLHLYPHLEERGFVALTEEQPNGTFLTNIRRG